ncbi:MAG TPA: hypothetical protein VKX17_21480 [Planctomycetota bacterium]|nr:hypothetical protein [Planctomycetota bacterium]
MLVGTDERCARCGTLLRAGRTVCPSCGLDQHSAEAQSMHAQVPTVPVADSKPAPAKKTICPACMSSVRDDLLLDYDGSRICPDCYERLKKKQRK